MFMEEHKIMEENKNEQNIQKSEKSEDKESKESEEKRAKGLDKKLDKKILFMFVAVIAVLTACFLLFYSKPSQEPQFVGLMSCMPNSDYLAGWKLVEYDKNLAEIQSELRKEWLAQNISDAAMLHYNKNSQDLYIWARKYPDNKSLAIGARDFTNPLAWREQSELAFGNGKIGLYKARESKPPLLLYLIFDDKLIYLAYYNSNLSYVPNNSMADKIFLTNLGREIYISCSNESK